MFDFLTERLRYRFTIGIVSLFLLSWMSSCNEMRYLMRGKTAEATITSIRDSMTPERHSEPAIRVDYTFSDVSGQAVQEHDLLPPTWPLDGSQKVDVEYLPGSDFSSRVKGHRDTLRVAIFCTMVGIGLLWFALLWYEGVRTSPNRRR